MQCNGPRISRGIMPMLGDLSTLALLQVLPRTMLGGLGLLGPPALGPLPRPWISRLLLLLLLRDTTCLDIRYLFRTRHQRLQGNTAPQGLDRLHELGIRIRRYHAIE